MTARNKTDMASVVRGEPLGGGSTPPVVENQQQVIIDLLDSARFVADFIAPTVGVAATDVNATFGTPLTCDVTVPDAAGDVTYPLIFPFACVITNVEINKAGAGAGNTIKLTTNADVDITNAIAADTDKTMTRAGTIDPAQRDVAAGGRVKLVAHRAAGTMAAKVRIHVLRTA